MNIDKFEVWVHDNILKNAKIRHFLHNIYQRVLVAISPKFKSEGAITKISPDDDYEYLFGYYDKCPWSDDGRYLLALRVKNACSHADNTSRAEIVIFELNNQNNCTIVAETHAWNVQQGCMLQWLDNETILYNDFRDNHYVSVVQNISNGSERIIGFPVYTVSSDKTFALSLDFSRLHRLRPGYGYANSLEETKDQLCPDSTCIWKLNLVSGEIQPLLKYTDFANFETKESMNNAEHKVNHLMISPDGKRFMVLHRWFKDKIKYTRLVTCNVDGTEMYNLSDDDFVSHCCWKNNGEILSYLNKRANGKGYYIMKDKTHEYKHLWSNLVMDGHPTYSYDGKFVVTDTYPDRKRIQSIYVMDGGRVKRIARLFSPFRFKGDVRCDLHPRWSKDGRQICFDGSADGKRGVYVINTAEIYKLPDKIESKNTDETPKISVIIPCYNCEDSISETLESLERQTYTNFEVICVNDGSKDSTLIKLNEWKNKSTLRIKIIDQPNGGVSTARNHGMQLAEGDNLVFLDSDDLYHDEYLKELIETKEKFNAQVVYCRVSRRYDDVMSYSIENGHCEVQDKIKAMSNLLYRMGEFGFCCYLYEKDILKQISLKFDENTKFGEDREFNWKYLAHCDVIGFVDMPLYWYRPNATSVTKGKASWRKTDLLASVKRTENYLTEQNCKFVEEYKSYMYARAMWSTAKTFAVSGDKGLFDRLIKEYDVKSCMKALRKDKNKLVALSSMIFLINPNGYYKIIRLKK